MALRVLDWMSIILLIIGGLSLGVVGVFNYDPIIHFFAQYLALARIIYFLIGLAALYIIFRISQVVTTFSPSL